MSSVNRQDEIALRRISWTLSVSFSEIPFSSEAISYGKPVLKTENRGFNTFAGVFDPGNGRTGPAFLEFPPAIFGRGIQRRLPFLQDIILKNGLHTPVPSKTVSDAMYLKKSAPFSDETSIYSVKSLTKVFLFSPKVATP